MKLNIGASQIHQLNIGASQGGEVGLVIGHWYRIDLIAHRLMGWWLK